MFLVLVMIEASDLVFAVGSIPAIFAVTTDPFIVFTSNIFAIMGLRALYFLLAGYGRALPSAQVRTGDRARCSSAARCWWRPWFHMPVLWSLR